jgi:glycosyltransferase involved in cell wall biosynthesis
MPTFINRNTYAVHLNGPDGQTVLVNSKQVIELPDFYHKYVQRGYITQVNGNVLSPETRMASIRKSVTQKVIRQGKSIVKPVQDVVREAVDVMPNAAKVLRRQQSDVLRKPAVNITDSATRPRVGTAVNANYLEVYRSFAARYQYAVSNDIGIGILTYNRPGSLKRLLQSIESFTDLDKTVVFISDDNSDDPEQISLLDSLVDSKYVVLRNRTRAGVAGNSNRLLKCLSRFRYGLLLNDDVEVLKLGWDSFYPDNLNASGLKHFIYREIGVYGASAATAYRMIQGNSKTSHIKEVEVSKVDSKPHGAVLAFDNSVDVGYFDEGFGVYGMEHIEWSDRFHKDGHQEAGYFDVAHSNEYFRIHAEASAVADRVMHLQHSKKYLAVGKFARSSSYVEELPSLSIVVPIRVFGRQNAIDLIIRNIKALKFPHVDIIISEHDVSQNFDNKHVGIRHIFTAADGAQTLFNKSRAFNVGVNAAACNDIILHDADLMVHRSYASQIKSILMANESCHIGKFVIYLDQGETERVSIDGLSSEPSFERMVGYYEGGSLGVRRRDYWRCGGFNEAFYGYGNEDTEFFGRLSQTTKFCNERTEAFIHLWHPRVENWIDHHQENKMLERKLVSNAMDKRLKDLNAQNVERGYKCEC